MPYPATVFEILLAGPRDVEAERLEIADAIQTWSTLNAHHRSIVIRPVMWETDVYPELGDDPQAVINKQLAGRCDALIAVFKTRFGTKTPRGASGTAEEIDRFQAEQKPVALYFADRKAPYPVDDPDQLKAVRDFQKSKQNDGIFREYWDLPSLRKLADTYLAGIGYRFEAELKEATRPPRGAAVEVKPAESDGLVLAALGRVAVEKGSRLVDGQDLAGAPELVGLTEQDTWDSMSLLSRDGLLAPLSGSGPGHLSASITWDGLESWLRSFVADYDGKVDAVIRSIVRDGNTDLESIGAATFTPRLVVDNILEQLRNQGRLTISRTTGGTTVKRVGPELRRKYGTPT